MAACEFLRAPSSRAAADSLTLTGKRYKIYSNVNKIDLMAIQSFACDKTEALFETGKTRDFAAIKSVAERKLTMLDAAVTLDFLRSPPGNRLEALVGNRAGQHSIRINSQWRICFVWTVQGPLDVEIVDYHA